MGIQIFTNRSLAEHDKKKDVRIAALEYARQDQAERNASLVKQCVDMQAQLDMDRDIRVSQAEVIATQKTIIADLEADAAEHAVASKRYREHITKLQSGDAFKELLAFLRSIESRSIRPDRGGKELLERARALLSLYGSTNDSEVIGN